MLRLVLAGSDLGSLPGLERILAWAIGALAPAVLFWKRPPDWGSLLLVRLPLQGRDRSQQQLSRDLQTLPVKLIAAAGVVPLLMVLWWIDTSALLVADLSPFSNGSRLGSLLLATPLLALLLWQWHQLVQCFWLLIRRDDATAADSAASESDWREACLSIGLGVIQLPPLDWATRTPSPGDPASAVATPSVASDPALQKTPSQASEIGTQAPPWWRTNQSLSHRPAIVLMLTARQHPIRRRVGQPPIRRLQPSLERSNHNRAPKRMTAPA